MDNNKEPRPPDEPNLDGPDLDGTGHYKGGPRPSHFKSALPSENDIRSAGKTLPEGNKYPKFKLSLLQYLFVILLCSIGITAVAAVAYTVNNKNKENLRDIFLQVAEDRFWSLENNLSHDQDILRAVSTAMATFDEVNQRQFSALTMKLLIGNTSIQSIFWLPRITGELSGTTSVAGSETWPVSGTSTGISTGPEITEMGPNGKLRSVSKRKFHFPVLYGEPAGVLKSVQGVDFATIEDIRAALFEARDSGEMSITDASSLSMLNSQGTDILVVLPIYKTGISVHTMRDRRQHLRGFVIGYSEVARIFRNSTARFKATAGVIDTNLYLFDKAAPLGKQLIYTSDGKKTRERDLRKNRYVSYAIETVSRDWLVIVTPSNIQSEVAFSSAAILIFAAGILAVFVFGIYLHQQFLQTVLVELKVQEKTTELQRSERRFRRLFENAVISIWNEDMSGVRKALLDLQQNGVSDFRQYFEDNKQAAWDILDKIKVLHFNEATLKLFGAKTEEQLRKRLHLTFAPDTINVFIEELCAIAENKKVFHSEATMRTIDGLDFDAIVTFQIPRTEQGYKSVSVSVIDISEQKKAERELLVAKNEAIKATMAKSEFLANVSHELRTPLNAIIGFAQMLQSETHGPLGSDKNKEYIDIINDSGDHLHSVIGDILDLSKIEAGEEKLFDQKIIIQDIVHECIEMMSATAAKKYLALPTEIALDIPPLLADRPRVKQILLNLLSNAIKFTPEYGEVKTKLFSNAKNSIFLIVKDTGVGISPEDLDKVLEPFGQVEDTYSKSHEGTGLGLSLVKSLIELHGGKITIESEFGIGTTVTIQFPPERAIIS